MPEDPQEGKATSKKQLDRIEQKLDDLAQQLRVVIRGINSRR